MRPEQTAAPSSSPSREELLEALNACLRRWSIDASEYKSIVWLRLQIETGKIEIKE